MSLLRLLPLGKEGEEEVRRWSGPRARRSSTGLVLRVSYILKQPWAAAAIIVRRAQIPVPLLIWANVVTSRKDSKCLVPINCDLITDCRVRQSPDQSTMGLRGGAGLQPILPSPQRLASWRERSQEPTVGDSRTIWTVRTGSSSPAGLRLHGRMSRQSWPLPSL